MTPVADDDNPRRGTSTGAARLGAALADLAERHRRPGDPDPCSSCGLKKGTLANMAGQTMIDAMNVLAGIDGDVFGCHHGMKDREPTKACAGWLAARRASRDELLQAIGSVAIPNDDNPENDPVGVYVAAWAKQNDPEGKLDSYQLARLWEKTGPHEIRLDA
jgi:hypothetical protein